MFCNLANSKLCNTYNFTVHENVTSLIMLFKHGYKLLALLAEACRSKIRNLSCLPVPLVLSPAVIVVCFWFEASPPLCLLFNGSVLVCICMAFIYPRETAEIYLANTVGQLGKKKVQVSAISYFRYLNIGMRSSWEWSGSISTRAYHFISKCSKEPLQTQPYCMWLL